MLGPTATNIRPKDPLLCLCGGHWLAPSLEDTVLVANLPSPVLECPRARDSAQFRCLGLLYTSLEVSRRAIYVTSDLACPKLQELPGYHGEDLNSKPVPP